MLFRLVNRFDSTSLVATAVLLDEVISADLENWENNILNNSPDVIPTSFGISPIRYLKPMSPRKVNIA
jgi:hypothetical protein